MRVVVKMIDAVSVEEARAPHQAMHFVTPREQEFGKVRAGLPSYACDQRAPRHNLIYRTWIVMSFRNLSPGGGGETVLITSCTKSAHPCGGRAHRGGLGVASAARER